jgi:hypothetical protein
MTYMVLTAKHTEGIALWRSAVTTRDMRVFRRYRGGNGDIVREFVDACRAHGLKVGLYYCFPGDYSDEEHHNAPPTGKPDLHGLPPEASGDFDGFMRLDRPIRQQVHRKPVARDAGLHQVPAAPLHRRGEQCP